MPPTVAVAALAVAVAVALLPAAARAWSCEGHALATQLGLNWLAAEAGAPAVAFFDAIGDAVAADAFGWNGGPTRGVGPRRSLPTMSCIPDDARGNAAPAAAFFRDRVAWHFQDAAVADIDGNAPPATSKASSSGAPGKNDNGEVDGGRTPGGGGGGDLVRGLTSLVRELRQLAADGAFEFDADRDAAAKAAAALVMALHLAADAHQPLHSCAAAHPTQFAEFHRANEIGRASCRERVFEAV